LPSSILLRTQLRMGAAEPVPPDVAESQNPAGRAGRSRPPAAAP
jgi:hypothetical protein